MKDKIKQIYQSEEDVKYYEKRKKYQKMVDYQSAYINKG
jgi:hypothetical protein